MTDPESESSHLGSMEAELTGLADGLDGDRKEKRNTRLTRKAPHQYGMWRDRTRVVVKGSGGWLVLLEDRGEPANPTLSLPLSLTCKGSEET